MNETAPSVGYYAEQLNGVFETSNTEYVSVRFCGELTNTNWIGLNEESAQAIVDALRRSFKSVR